MSADRLCLLRDQKLKQRNYIIYIYDINTHVCGWLFSQHSKQTRFGELHEKANDVKALSQRTSQNHVFSAHQLRCRPMDLNSELSVTPGPALTE